ncbi:hypothetical protein [Nonomuraea sp. NPDC005650]|uniref:hypothetical protein n=1 Tax=Nonomuraea sp. NPDC005650 TaxID=3157045 RepID=UPI0033B8FF89
MPMSHYAVRNTPAPDQVGLDVTPANTTLVIAEFRLTAARADMKDLVDTALVLDRLEQVIPAMRRQVEADIAARKQAEQQRITAAAQSGPPVQEVATLPPFQPAQPVQQLQPERVRPYLEQAPAPAGQGMQPPAPDAGDTTVFARPLQHQPQQPAETR